MKKKVLFTLAFTLAFTTSIFADGKNPNDPSGEGRSGNLVIKRSLTQKGRPSQGGSIISELSGPTTFLYVNSETGEETEYFFDDFIEEDASSIKPAPGTYTVYIYNDDNVYTVTAVIE